MERKKNPASESENSKLAITLGFADGSRATCVISEESDECEFATIQAGRTLDSITFERQENEREGTECYICEQKKPSTQMIPLTPDIWICQVCNTKVRQIECHTCGSYVDRGSVKWLEHEPICEVCFGEYTDCPCGNTFRVAERQNACAACQETALRTAAKVAVSLNTTLNAFCEEMAATTETAADFKDRLIGLGIDEVWSQERE